MAKWNKGEPKWPGVYLICYTVKGVQIYSVGHYRMCGEWVDKSGDPIKKRLKPGVSSILTEGRGRSCREEI